MAKDIASSHLLTPTQMAELIFHTRNTERVRQVHDAAATLVKEEWLHIPGTGRVARNLMLDWDYAEGHAEPILYMDARIEPLIKQKLGFVDFLPLQKNHFISVRNLHDHIGRSTNPVIRQAQREAIEEALHKLMKKDIIDLQDEYGNPDRLLRDNCIIHTRRGRLEGLYFDPRLKNDPSLSKEAIALRTAEIRGNVTKDTGVPQYANHRQQEWLAPSTIARKLPVEFRTPAGRAAITRQLAELFANKNPAVGKFANPGYKEGIYRLNPAYLHLVDMERLRQDMKNISAISHEIDGNKR